MPRMARLVVPDLPHHVTQRGNRRMDVFFSAADYRRYLELMAESCAKAGVEIWAYCLMPNHVHLIAVPRHETALSQAIGMAHRRYAARINRREGWSGHLWQDRFASAPMDEAHLIAAARYVELNPVRAGLIADPGDYRWSSARAHLDGEDDALVATAPLRARIPDWRTLLLAGLSEVELERLRRHFHFGWPLGDDEFLDALSRRYHLPVRPRPRGPRRPKGPTRNKIT